MIRGTLLWAQLVVGFAIAVENGVLLVAGRGLTWRNWLALVVGLCLMAIALFELFLMEYHLMPTGIAVVLMFLLDCVAFVLYVVRPRTGFTEA